MKALYIGILLSLVTFPSLAKHTPDTQRPTQPPIEFDIALFQLEQQLLENEYVPFAGGTASHEDEQNFCIMDRIVIHC